MGKFTINGHRPFGVYILPATPRFQVTEVMKPAMLAAQPAGELSGQRMPSYLMAFRRALKGGDGWGDSVGKKKETWEKWENYVAFSEMGCVRCVTPNRYIDTTKMMINDKLWFFSMRPQTDPWYAEIDARGCFSFRDISVGWSPIGWSPKFGWCLTQSARQFLHWTQDEKHVLRQRKL